MKLPLRFSYCILLSLVMLLGAPAWAQVPAFEWAAGGEKTSSYEEQAQNRGVAVDAAGNTYVTGTFRRKLRLGATTLTTSTGDYDVYVAKLDAKGHYLWAVQAGGRDEDIGNGIALDADGNIHVIGYIRSDVAMFGGLPFYNSSFGASLFLAKLSPNGTWLRVLQAGGTGSDYTTGTALAVDKAGNTYVTGSFYGEAIFGSTFFPYGAHDMFVAKVDASGAWQWAVRAEGDGYDFGYAIAVDDTGNAYVTGSFGSNTILFGNTVLVANTASVRNAFSEDLFVAKLDAGGNWLWASQPSSSTSRSAGAGIAVDAAGNAYVTGKIAGTAARVGATPLPKSDQNSDLLVAKLSPGGSWQWAVRGGGPGNDNGAGVALDAENHVTVVGSFATDNARFGPLPPLAASGPTDVVVAQLGTDGSWRWAVRGGGPGLDYGTALAQDAKGNTRIAGTFEGATMDLGTTSLPGGAKYYTYLADQGFVASLIDLARRSPKELTFWPNPSHGSVWATGLEASPCKCSIRRAGSLPLMCGRRSRPLGWPCPFYRPGYTWFGAARWPGDW